MTLSFPLGVTSDSVAVAANGILKLADRAKVKQRDATVTAKISNAGLGETTLGVDAGSGSVTSVATVTLRDRAVVTGAVQTGGTLVRYNGTLVTGTITQHATLTPLSMLFWSVTLPSTNSGDVIVPPDTSKTVAPGSYAKLTVYSRSTARLKTGTYFVTSLDIEPQATLSLDKSAGPITIYVTNDIIFRGKIATTAGAEGDFLVVQLGSAPIPIEASFTGSIVAPNASLTLASVAHRGTYFARDVEVQAGGSITAVPFPIVATYGCPATELAALLNQCKVRCLLSGEAETTDGCDGVCNAQTAGFQETANETCEKDPDHDGVINPKDKCPGTPLYVHVNQDGCPDADGDGIPEPDDQCPNTPRDTKVNVKGCPVVTTCKEGNCNSAPPICTTDQCREVAIDPFVPPDVMIGGLGIERTNSAHPRNCPTDKSIPMAPTLTTPPGMYNPIAVTNASGALRPVSFTLANGKFASGDTVPLTFAWNAVDSTCRPVKYSVFIEYYHCHGVAGVTEPASYLNAGWCKWQPYSYETISSTSYQVNFELGRVMYQLHVPFFSNLGWTVPASGSFAAWYQPQWVRATVYAHDNNGHTSASAYKQNYYVIYEMELGTDDLRDLPMPPY